MARKYSPERMWFNPLLHRVTVTTLALLLGVAGGACRARTQATRTPAPAPTIVLEPPLVTIVGIVLDTGTSGRTITLLRPVDGIEVIGLTEATVVVDRDGNLLPNQEIRPGTTIVATGKVTVPGALVAGGVRILNGPGMPPALGEMDQSAPAEVVRDFLLSLSNDPSGRSSTAFVSPDLQLNVLDGASPRELLGLSNVPRQFDLSPATVGRFPNTAVVRAVIYLEKWEYRLFTLAREGSEWRIFEITEG